MLREQEAAEHRRNVLEALARQQDAKRADIPDNLNKPWQQGGVQGAIERVTGQAKANYTREPITPD